MSEKFYIKIAEYTLRSKSEDRYRAKYVIGPYHSEAKAVDSYYEAHYLFKDEVDSEDHAVYWDYFVFTQEDVESVSKLPAC